MHWLTYVENPGIALAPGFRPSGEGAQLTLNRSSWLGNALIGLSQSWRGSQLLQKLDDKEGVPKEKWGDQKADESLLSGQAQMSTTKARREPRPGQDAEDPSFCFTAAPRGHRAGMPILVSTIRPGRPGCASGLGAALLSASPLLSILGRCRVLEPGQGSSSTGPSSWGPGVPSQVVTVVTQLKMYGT